MRSDFTSEHQREKNKQQTICNLFTLNFILFIYYFISFNFFLILATRFNFHINVVFLATEIFVQYFQQRLLHYCTFQNTRADQRHCKFQTCTSFFDRFCEEEDKMICVLYESLLGDSLKLGVTSWRFSGSSSHFPEIH